MIEHITVSASTDKDLEQATQAPQRVRKHSARSLSSHPRVSLNRLFFRRVLVPSRLLHSRRTFHRAQEQQVSLSTGDGVEEGMIGDEAGRSGARPTGCRCPHESSNGSGRLTTLLVHLEWLLFHGNVRYCPPGRLMFHESLKNFKHLALNDMKRLRTACSSLQSPTHKVDAS